MDSNRVRVALVRETTIGVTPASPRMRTLSVLGEGLAYRPVFVQPGSIRADRMNVAPTRVSQENGGPLNVELTYPTNFSALSELYRSAFYSQWNNAPQFDNDLTADSVITAVTATGQTITVVDQSGSGGFSGTGFKSRMLCRLTGFTNAANNGVKRVTTGNTATSVAFLAGTGLVDEAAPPAGARMKCVGFEGPSGDITATATGLAATTVDFTVFNMVVGQWVKIGGTANGDRFATAACNGWARITAIGVSALTLDNLPAGWATDAGTGKTIRVFFGDYMRNGVTRSTMSVERGFLSQTTPTYILQRGLLVDQFSLDFSNRQIVTGAFSLLGLTGVQGTSANGASYDDAPNAPPANSNLSLQALSENGAAITSANWASQFTLSLANNARRIEAVGNDGAVEMGVGEGMVTGRLDTYFSSNAFLTKLFSNTLTSLSARTVIGSQAIIHTLPAVTFTDGASNAAAKNQDVKLPLSFMSSLDTLTNCQIQADRFEYFEV
jgi:hypothetical protein